MQVIKLLLPRSLLLRILPVYHFLLALIGALIYRFPSREIIVIGITGTKGKTSTAEILNNILEASGKTTALLGTLRFKIGGHNERNLKKMTMPGRFFVQKFLRKAVGSGCTHAIIEMTSEGAKQFRHRFIDMDALIFTNLAPEHIESHGSYEKYRDAKLSIGEALSHSKKGGRFMIANADDVVGQKFLSIRRVTPLPYTLERGSPMNTGDEKNLFTWKEKQVHFSLSGTFNILNAIAAATCAEALGVDTQSIIRGIELTKKIEGRMEYIHEGQKFPVIVDYAHTPDSLRAVYESFQKNKLICVLGNTGGGRDKWKRPIMGKIAEEYCSEIILTNEDPYDEDPRGILDEIKKGIEQKTPRVILDRREAINMALRLAQTTPHPAVLITGKGTDPFIMGPHNSKTTWDDRAVTREELKKILNT